MKVLGRIFLNSCKEIRKDVKTERQSFFVKCRRNYVLNNFNSIVYNHTIHTLISDLFGVVKSFGIRGEGRRDWEVELRYGVKFNYMIIFLTYIILIKNTLICIGLL